MPFSLVTGATGFIGRRLVERLVERGDRVACLVRNPARAEPLAALGAELRLGSLDDRESLAAAVQGTDVVHHLAGLTRGSSEAVFTRVNAQGTERLCEAVAGLPTPPTVVVVSSLAAAGPSPPGEPHTEATRSAPISKYGRSKRLAEDLARGYADRLRVSIVRPPVVFGPGDRDGLLLFQALRRFPVHAVPQLRGLPLSLVYVDDLVEALIAVAERGERLLPLADCGELLGFHPTGRYYAADPAASSYAEMGRMAAAAMGRRVWVLCRRKYPFLPVALAGDLWGRFTGKPPVFGMDKLIEASQTGWVCDPAKIGEGLGWAPPKPLAERYRDTHAWYVAEGWL